MKSNSVSDCNKGQEMRISSRGVTQKASHYWDSSTGTVSHAGFALQVVPSCALSPHLETPRTPVYHSVKPCVARLYSCLRKRPERFFKKSLCAELTEHLQLLAESLWCEVWFLSVSVFCTFTITFALSCFRESCWRNISSTFLYLKITASSGR